VLYIGELCRYLLNAPPSDAERDNPVRVAVGNGLRADVWDSFARRFGLESIHEFYGSTEGPGGIFNLTSRSGSVGRIPFRRLLPFKLVRYDVEAGEHVRGPDGFCIECEAGEVGELLVAIKDKPLTALTEFKGYTDEAASRRKRLTDVFVRGDQFYRSGDLLRFDEDDYFYFVDRIGETFRWKGENVSTAEVAEVLSRTPGVRELAVLGVKVPGTEGRAGMAALVCEGPFDAAAFGDVSRELPDFAQVRFVRVMGQLATTSTFKIIKSRIDAEGIDPAKGECWLRTEQGYVPLTEELWRGVQSGAVRL
jgi:fatty-acyl-CoA synthase